MWLSFEVRAAPRIFRPLQPQTRISLLYLLAHPVTPRALPIANHAMSVTIWATWHPLRLVSSHPNCLLGTSRLRSVKSHQSLFQKCSLIIRKHPSILGPSFVSKYGSVCLQGFHTSPSKFARSPLRPHKYDSIKKIRFSLSGQSIAKIFGKSLSRDDGNHLLTKLQKHRQEGTLDEDMPYSEKTLMAGLNYLQSKYPMDEEAAIIARIDKELDNRFRAPQQNPEHSPYGTSKLANLRKENEERFEREQAAREANAKKAIDSSGPTELVAKPRTLKNLVHGKDRTYEEPEWIKKYREKATETEIPNTSTFARLFPSGLFTLIVVILSLSFAQNYVPPSQLARLFPDTPPAAATMLTILSINTGVFLLWRLPQLWAFMNKYFIVVAIRPKAASMLFAPFSHQDFFSHMLFNMSIMWFLGGKCKIIRCLKLSNIDND